MFSNPFETIGKIVVIGCVAFTAYVSSKMFASEEGNVSIFRGKYRMQKRKVHYESEDENDDWTGNIK